MDRRWPWKKKSSDKADKVVAVAAAATLASAASQGDQVEIIFFLHKFYLTETHKTQWLGEFSFYSSMLFSCHSGYLVHRMIYS